MRGNGTAEWSQEVMKAPTSINQCGYAIDRFIATAADTVDFSAATSTRPAGRAGLAAIIRRAGRTTDGGIVAEGLNPV